MIHDFGRILRQTEIRGNSY